MLKSVFLALALTVALASAQVPTIGTPANQTFLTTTIQWVVFAFAAAGVLASMIFFAVAFFKNQSSRQRVYRGIAAYAFNTIATYYVFTLGSAQYLNQTSITWDGSAVASAGWIFGVAAWNVFWAMLFYVSYIPARNILSHAVTQYGKTEDMATKLSVADAEIVEKADFLSSHKSSFTMGALVLAIFAVGAYGILAMQTVFVMSLWQSVGFAIAAGLIIYGASVVMSIGIWNVSTLIEKRSGLDTEEIGYRWSLTKKFLGFYWLFLIVSTVTYIVAWGITPSVASAQPTYTLENAVAVLVAGILFTHVCQFFTLLSMDIWVKSEHAEEQSDSKTKRA